jgi:hypothetical protein
MRANILKASACHSSNPPQEQHIQLLFYLISAIEYANCTHPPHPTGNLFGSQLAPPDRPSHQRFELATCLRRILKGTHSAGFAIHQQAQVGAPKQPCERFLSVRMDLGACLEASPSGGRRSNQSNVAAASPL